MNSRRTFVSILGVALVVGLVLGLSRREALANDPGDYYWIEGYGAQDANGDGMATLGEGAIDIDGDGQFTWVEADALGMTHFIAWLPQPVGNPLPGMVDDPNKICENVTIGTTRTRRCYPANKYCRHPSGNLYCTGSY